MGRDKTVLVGMATALLVASVTILALVIVLVQRDLAPQPVEVQYDAPEGDQHLTSPDKSQKREAITSFLSGIQRKNMMEHHRFLASKPHPSGSERSEVDIVNYLADALRKSGFDQVKKVPYLVLHQHPDPDNPNSVRLIGDGGEILLDAKMSEDKIPGVDTDIGPAYLAYSAQGTVEGDLIFVNYATYEDFDFLKKEGVSVTGSICLATYGKGYRSEKVRLCHENGGIGVILFSDPINVAPKGEDFVFPKSQFVGGSAMQRGSLDFSQDVETPGYPSIPEALRTTDHPSLPKIPAQVIGYDDARVLLQLLGGEDWNITGGFNFTYRTGPFDAGNKGKKVRLSVNNVFERLTVHDVIGVIKGGVEPDRFVVVGNHHDAWGFGATDPNSGTPAILELGRTLGAMVRQGWRPRRSIVFAFWGAEEIGMAGSREWVEENIQLLDSGAVGNINLDYCASGTKFGAEASPSIRNIVYEATDVFPVTQMTCQNTTQECRETNQSSSIGVPGGGSDNIAFNVFAGIPAVRFSFTADKELTGTSSAAAYHTAYETLELYQKFIDPDYALMERCAQLTGALTLSLSETEVLPYSMVDFGRALQDGYGGLQGSMDDFQKHNVSAGWLGDEVDLFAQSAAAWHKWISDRSSFDMVTLRLANQRMMLVERAFIKPGGLLGSPIVRNLAFGPWDENGYDGAVFPILLSQLHNVARLKPDSNEASKTWSDIRRHVNDIALAVRSARMLLDPDRIV